MQTIRSHGDEIWACNLNRGFRGMPVRAGFVCTAVVLCDGGLNNGNGEEEEMGATINDTYHAFAISKDIVVQENPKYHSRQISCPTRDHS
jgi:hypothetical protein